MPPQHSPSDHTHIGIMASLACARCHEPFWSVAQFKSIGDQSADPVASYDGWVHHHETDSYSTVIIMAPKPDLNDQFDPEADHGELVSSDVAKFATQGKALILENRPKIGAGLSTLCSGALDTGPHPLGATAVAWKGDKVYCTTDGCKIGVGSLIRTDSDEWRGLRDAFAYDLDGAFREAFDQLTTDLPEGRELKVRNHVDNRNYRKFM